MEVHGGTWDRMGLYVHYVLRVKKKLVCVCLFYMRIRQDIGLYVGLLDLEAPILLQNSAEAPKIWGHFQETVGGETKKTLTMDWNLPHLGQTQVCVEIPA